jgi:hypothetical protein
VEIIHKLAKIIHKQLEFIQIGKQMQAIGGNALIDLTLSRSKQE